MDGVHRFSDSVIDLAERLSNVADAAAGNPPAKGRNGGAGTTRWVLLPAAGAGLYALVKSDFFSRQAKGVVDEAKTRASDLPNDLMKRVGNAGQKSASQSSTTSQRTSAPTRGGRRRSSARRRRQTASSRNSKSG
jgi:hypothetical protein